MNGEEVKLAVTIWNFLQIKRRYNMENIFDKILTEPCLESIGWLEVELEPRLIGVMKKNEQFSQDLIDLMGV